MKYKFTSSILLTVALMLVVFVSNTQAREPQSIKLTDSEMSSTALERVTQITSRQATTTTAGVWAVHVAPFSNTITGTTVDVRINGTQILTGVPYKATSGGYLNLPPGSTLVEIVAGGNVAMSGTFTLITGTNYTLVASGDGMNKSLQLFPIVDDLTQLPDKAKVNIIHTAPFTSGPATVDVLSAVDNTPVFTGLNYTQTTNYLPLTPTTYALKVVESGTTTPTLIDIPNFPVQAGEVWNVFAVGGANNFLTETLPIKIQQALSPTLQVTPTVINLTATEGMTTNPSEMISITNLIPGAIEWSATSSHSWLQVNDQMSVTSTTPSMITATANISDVTADTYTGTITVTATTPAQSSPQTVTVVLTVQPAAAMTPTLLVNPGNLPFTAFVGQADPPAGQVLSVTSNMTQTLAWTATTDASWLTLSSPTGTTSSDITATVSISNLTANMYSGVITFESAMAANSPVTVPVTLDLRNPGLQVDPAMLTFNAVLGDPNPSGQNIAISNSLTNTLVWTATSNAPAWLQLTSISQITPVSTVTGTTPATITAMVDTSSVTSAGFYSNTIVVDAGLAQNSPQTVTVYLNITEPVITPVLQVDPLALSFTAVESGTNPAGRIFNITNGVTGTLAWTATSSVPSWLMVNGAATLTGTTPASVTATVDISGVPANTYSGVITVEGDMADNSPQIVSVTLTVQPAGGVVTPTLQVDPTMLMFTATEGMTNPPAQMISVTNAVTGTIDWTATSSDPNWLLVDGQATATGTTPSMIMATVDISGVVANTYTETIVINGGIAANSPQTVTVVLTVQPAAGPVLQVMPTGLTFTATEGDTDPADQTFQVMNTGSGTIDWTAVEDIPWLTLTPMSGISPTTVTASVAISGLTANTYTGIVVINDLGAANSPQTVAITLTVQPAGGPVLQVAPVELSFTATEGGNDPTDQTFQVTNTGSGTLDWTATENITWLTLSPMTGTAPSTVTASVVISGLTADTYTGTIVISGTNAANSPQTVTVTLTVEASTPTGFVYLPLIMRQPQPSATATPTDSVTATPTPTATSPTGQQPDLTSEIILEPANPTAGQDVTVKVIVRNIGTSAVTDGFWVDFYINPKQQPSTGGRWNDSALISELADPNGVQGIAWAITPDDFGSSLDPNESITLVSMPSGQTTNGEIGYSVNQTSWHGRFVSGTSALYSYADSYEVTGNVRGVIENEILDSFDNNGDALQTPEFGPLGEPLDIEVTVAEFAPRTNP